MLRRRNKMAALLLLVCVLQLFIYSAGDEGSGLHGGTLQVEEAGGGGDGGMAMLEEGVEEDFSKLVCDAELPTSCPAQNMTLSNMVASAPPAVPPAGGGKEETPRINSGSLRSEEGTKEGQDDYQNYKTDTNTSSTSASPPRIRFCNIPDEEQEAAGEAGEAGQGNETTTTTTRLRRRRYTLQGKKWSKTDLRWALRRPSRHTQRLDTGIIRQQMSAAFSIWQDASTLTFTEVHQDAPDVDIYVEFWEGDHGDGYTFDGPGNTLAHAFFPGRGRGGDVHFDDGDHFVRHSERGSGGKSLLITAAHELGHSLGLHHSDVTPALMAPYYQDFSEDFQLPEDDKRAIQVLYGTPDRDARTLPPPRPTTSRRPPVRPTRPPVRPTRPPVRPTRPPVRPTRPPLRPTQKPARPTHPPATSPPVRPSDHPPPPPTGRCPPRPRPDAAASPDVCLTGVDAATEFRGELFFFKGSHYWRVSRRGAQHPTEFPGSVALRFSPVQQVDAAYVDQAGHLVLFHEEHFYRFGYYLQVERTGRLQDLNINASQVHAAMVWGHNGRPYVFSGQQYWRLGQDGTADPDYPRDMAVWRGVPENVSAALTLGYDTYFLAGAVFWPFDSLHMRVRQPPLLAAPHWLQCPHVDRDRLMLCSSRAGTLGRRRGPFVLLATALVLLLNMM